MKKGYRGRDGGSQYGRGEGKRGRGRGREKIEASRTAVGVHGTLHFMAASGSQVLVEVHMCVSRRCRRCGQCRCVCAVRGRRSGWWPSAVGLRGTRALMSRQKTRHEG